MDVVNQIVTQKSKWIIIIMFYLIICMNSPGLAGDIKGRVTITRSITHSTKIGSRLIIQRYVKKSVTASQDKNPFRAKPVVVIYLDDVPWQKHKTNNKIMILDQKNETFIPHVLPIVAGTTVRFLNSDEVYHNVFSYSKAKSFDLGRYATGKYRNVTFDKPGVVKVYCDIHSHMNAFILVLKNPYFTVIDEAGNFELKNVPPGTYILKAWYGRWPEKSIPVTVPEQGQVELNFEFP